MIRHVFALLLIAWTMTAPAAEEKASYYLEIQGKPPAVAPAEFSKLEQSAYQSFADPEVYPPLVRAFAATSERVWAVIYGEVYAGRSADEKQRLELGALIFTLYRDAIRSTSGDTIQFSLTRHWTVDAERPELPFEMGYEVSTVTGLMASGYKPGDTLTIAALTAGRLAQVSIWREKNLPETELLRWQERIVQSGHFTAYNQWLFGGARPDEFESYRKAHREEYGAWLAWRAANAMQVDVPDFQRPLLSSDDPERELLMAGRALVQANKPVEALQKSFDVVARRLDSRHAAGSDTLYCARDQGEALVYLAMAAEQHASASVLGPTWSDAHYLKGYALLELGRLAESREALERAVALSPSNSQYLSELAYTYQVEKNWNEALARYASAENAAELSPDELRASDASRALRGQGFVLVELDRLDEAETIYRKAMAIDPQDRNSAGELKYIEQVRARKP